MVTDKQLHAIMPNCSAAKRADYLPFINQAMNEFEINTYLKQSAFLAQLAHESAELRYMEEIATGTAYEGRKNLGNTEPGDGKRFKGRGPIQLTGRANYKKYGNLLGLDLISNPKTAATKEVGFRIAGLYWKLNGLNELADKDQKLVTVKIKGKDREIPAFDYITYRINGGFNGKDDRQAYYTRALKALKPNSTTEVIDDEIADTQINTILPIDKGITTSNKPASETEGTPPPAPAVEIKASKPSLMSRLTAFSMPAGVTAAIGTIWKFAQNIPPWGWAILGGVFVVAMLAFAWLQNESMKRANERTLMVGNAAADLDKNNLRLI